MQLSNIPAKFNIPFASSAGGSYIRTIPQTPTGTPGQASLQSGFPPENFNPVSSGGVPPFGQDFNGLLNQVTAWNRWAGAGVAAPPYDATFQTAIGGYPNTSIVSSLVSTSTIYMSIVDNNLTNPDAGGAGWIIFFRPLIANTDIYVNASTGNDSNNGLSSGSAKATVQAGLNLAYTFPPAQFTLTIHVAAGTYTENLTSPLFPAANIVLNGAGIGSTIIASASGAAYAVILQGQTNFTVSNLTLSGTAIHGLVSQYNAQVSVSSVQFSNGLASSGGAHMLAWLRGNLSITGATTISANCGSVVDASLNGVIQYGNVTQTISTPITCSQAFAEASQSAIIEVNNPGAPSFVNPGNVTGSRYSSVLNGIIYAPGLGANFFPGNSAGTTGTGGQYVP